MCDGMSVCLTIPGRFPCLNDYIDEANLNRHRANKMKQEWTDLVRDIAILSRIRPRRCKQDFVFVFYEKNRKRDKDNVDFAKKFIFDGLVRAGVLPNDGWRWVGDYQIRVRLDRLNPRVEIYMRDSKED